MSGSPYYNQYAWRMRNDTNVFNGGTPSWITTENQTANEVITVATTFRIRFGVENSGTNKGTLVRLPWYNHEGGGWNQITTTSSVVIIDSSASTDTGQQTITTANFVLVTTPTAATATDGDGRDDGSLSNDNNYNQDQYQEVEYGFSVVRSDVSNGDNIQIRLGDDATGYDNYDFVATIEVDKPPSGFAPPMGPPFF
jgi:hypothetical protein